MSAMMNLPPSSHQDLAIPRQYDRWARVYDGMWGRYMDQTLPVLQQTAGVEPGERILDLGSGTGELERRLLASTPEAELVGVDLAPAMVESARQKLKHVPGISFVLADAHDLPFEDGTFDAVVSASTFHYFTAPEQILNEVARVLRPAGRLVLLDWCRDFWTCWIMDGILRRVDPAHLYCYTLEELTALVESSPLTYRYGFRYRFDLIWGMMVIEAIL